MTQIQRQEGMGAEECDLRHALEIVAGVLSAAAQARKIDEGTVFRFTGRWAHLGSITLGEALDTSNAALGRSALAQGETDAPE